MHRYVTTCARRWATLLICACMFGLTGAGAAQAPAPSAHAIDIPPWFAQTFLDFREDVADAAREGKRLMVYVGQDGCPYCTKLMAVNFSQREVVERTRTHFVATALNLWGDREVTWIDGRTMSEKELGRVLGVQFTPTLLFFDEAGKVVVRLDGYYPPQQFEAVLDYVAAKEESRQSLGDYLARHARPKANAKLHGQPFFMAAPYDLVRKPGDKPLAVLFETVDCTACDEMHGEAFRRKDVLDQVRRFDVVRLSLAASTPVVTPAGQKTTAHAWGRELQVAYTPAVVFFDANGVEVFRMGAYLRPFHFASSFAYVADRGYVQEPSFQRYLQSRADRMRARGQRVDLWK